jgi:endonuclease/exonuclease/phosphatase family metal-dependent hydrolase
MIKLISLNIEANKHHERVLPFITQEKPDIICLQEAPEDFQMTLREIGLHTTFLPMCIRNVDGRILNLGVIVASPTPHTYDLQYYHTAKTPTKLLDKQRILEMESFGLINVTITHNEQVYRVVTTHFYWTPHGTEDPIQTALMDNLLKVLPEEPHILCGDFNIPRGFNALYPVLTARYTDTVPSEYQSSLDRDLHRLGKSEHLEDPIFDKYMVDYVFTEPPYTASNVRLQFGVSDHAAVVAHISKSTT